MSAYGLSLADVVHEEQEACNLELNEANMKGFVAGRIVAMSGKCVEHLCGKEEFEVGDCRADVFLNLRYDGTDTGIMCQARERESGQFGYKEFEDSFLER